MSLTTKQEHAVRSFYADVLGDDSLFNGDAGASRGAAAACCLSLLGYTIIDGKHVRESDIRPATYGRPNHYEDRWAKDTAAMMEKLNEADSDTDTNEADNSEPSESPEIRKAVLSEDV